MTPNQYRRALPRYLVLTAAGCCLLGFAVACESDDPGHSKTTSKETIKHPDGTATTTTETREKDTKIYPK